MLNQLAGFKAKLKQLVSLLHAERRVGLLCFLVTL